MEKCKDKSNTDAEWYHQMIIQDVLNTKNVGRLNKIWCFVKVLSRYDREERATKKEIK